MYTNVSFGICTWCWKRINWWWPISIKFDWNKRFLRWYICRCIRIWWQLRSSTIILFIAPLQTRKFRGRNNDFESTFQQVASSFATFLDKQSEEKLPQIISSQQVESKLKYIQMYEELDKALDNVNFLDAVKLLTNTTESATSKFQKKMN